MSWAREMVDTGENVRSGNNRNQQASCPIVSLAWDDQKTQNDEAEVGMRRTGIQPDQVANLGRLV